MKKIGNLGCLIGHPSRGTYPPLSTGRLCRNSPSAPFDSPFILRLSKPVLRFVEGEERPTQDRFREDRGGSPTSRVPVCHGPFMVSPGRLSEGVRSPADWRRQRRVNLSNRERTCRTVSEGKGTFSFWFVPPLVMLLLLALLPAGSEAASSDDLSRLPWALLPKVSKLDDNQKSDLFEALKQQPSYGDCKDATFSCLQKRPPDKTAVRIANFCAYLLSLGIPSVHYGPLIRERGKFVNAEPLDFFSFEETPIMGNERAPITIVEFAEFECPYCVTMGPILKKLVEESNGSVRVLFKHFPLKSHPGSVLASKAAQAAQRQGKFWEMYEVLFKNMKNQQMEDLLKYARELGLDMEKFKRDMEDSRLAQLIERDKMEGLRANLKGTPTLFIDGKLYHLRHEEYFLKDIIDEEAERLKIKPPYKEWAY